MSATNVPAASAAPPGDLYGVPPLPRRLFHLLAGSVFPTALLWAPEAPLMWAAVAMASTAVLVEVLRFRFLPLNRWLTQNVRFLMKEREHTSPFGSTYALGATAVVLASMQQPVGVLALYYMSLGDPAAAFVGERYGSHRLLGKSLEGGAAFLAVALAIGALLLSTSLDTTYPVMVVGACAAMLAELLPVPPDDNLKIPLAAGGAMTLTAHFWA